MTVIPELERDLVAAAGRLRDRRLPLRLKSLAAAASLAAAVVLVGVVALDRDGQSERDAGSTVQPAGPGPDTREGGRPVDPRTVWVSVLNATGTPGLASAIGDELRAHRFKLANVGNSPGRRRMKSVILFSRGHRREAIAVGRQLGIEALKRIGPKIDALAGPARVTVIAGSDQRQRKSTP